MELREQLRSAWDAVADQPRRAIVSALGVYWGAAAIVVLLSVSSGFREFMHAEMGGYGRPMLFVIPGVTSSGFPGHRAGVRIELARSDLAFAERRAAEHLLAILPEHRRGSDEKALVEARGRRRRFDVSGVDERFAEHRRFALEKGRTFDAAEVARSRAVAVLGYDAAERLFGRAEDGVGRTIRVNGVAFQVVGVAAKKGRQYFNTNRKDNELVLVPITTAEARLGHRERSVAFASLILRPGADGDAALREVLAALGPRAGFHPDDTDAVRHFDLSQILGLIDLLHVGFGFFIAFAGTMTLAVGGVGIANAHLASLTERTAELALARALGARSRVLVQAAVLESLYVSAITAAAGVATGVGACWILAWLLAGTGLAPILSIETVAIAGLALAGVSVVAALLPALRVRATDVSAALRAV
jgi:putative ABC transport system permease protein